MNFIKKQIEILEKKNFEIKKFQFLIVLILFLIKPIILFNQINDSIPDSAGNQIKHISGDSSAIKITADSITVKKSKSGIDSTVVYSAKDTVVFDLKKKVMRLRGDSKLNYREQKLDAEVIEIYFDESLLKSEGVRDSNYKIYGYPRFTDKGETFVGERILYNFKTKQGTISLGETEITDGFYFGSKIKRVSESELFIKDGCYTTCDKPHPHYYFGSPEMKVSVKDRVFIDPIIFYVEDMPIFMLPFGLFFPNKSGRQSGIIIPSFFFSQSRGVVFQDLGLYLALSDYYDTQFKIDFFTKGGYTIKNNTRWKLRDVFDGSMDLQYGKTRYAPDEPYTQNYMMSFRHNHKLTPQSRIDASMQFMSSDFYGNTSMNLQDRLQQSIRSNASFSKSFDNGSSFSISLSRDQNLINKEVRQTFPQLSYSMPQYFPFKSLVSSKNWLKDVTISYSGSANYYSEYVRKMTTIPVTDDSSYTDTNYINNFRSSISHSPSISISPKFGYFTVSPSISFRANNFFRRLTRTYNSTDSTTVDNLQSGFFTEYWYSFGVNVQTRLFGIVKPKIFGINAFRHTFQPSVGFSYTPDFSSENYGFYGKYYDLGQNREVTYSRFEKDGGGGAPRSLSKSLNYSILNSFEAKVAQGDTIPDKNLDLFRWTINGSYDFARDSLNFSDIAMTFRIPTLNIVNLSANANFTLYDEAPVCDPLKCELTNNYTKINKLLIENGKGIMRPTNISLQLSTSFSSEGVSTNAGTSQQQTTSTQDSIGLGERFSQRIGGAEEQFDMYGDNSPGFSPISVPWNLSMGLNFQYSQYTINRITRRVNFNATFSFKLTPTWSFDGSAQYDFVKGELLAPSINITKDLHCWALNFSWYPIGYNRGFYLRFGIKAPQLQDLKLEKRSSPIMR